MQVLQAFRDGEVDAAALWEPHISQLAREVGDKAQVLTAPGLIVSPFLLVGRADYVQQHPENLTGVLRALLAAEQMAQRQPAAVKTLLASYHDFNRDEFDYIWSLHDFQLLLDQPLPFMLESVARWQISLQPPAERAPLPNYLDFLYPDGLQAVKPEAVTLIP
jgi:NitT/TauT family transport system substrate-binding protein